MGHDDRTHGPPRVVYLIRHGGIASRTPDGWESAVFAAGADGSYSPEAAAAIAEADMLVVGLEPVPAALLEAAPRLKLVQRLGVGFDNIDLAAAERRGVPVCYMPDFNAATVAEHTVMLILGLLRRVLDSTLLMKAGRWPAVQVASAGLFDLQGKTVGILGFGAIGREVARRLRGFDVRLLYFDRTPAAADRVTGTGAAFAPLERLLRESDVVTVHLPHTPETHQLIGRRELDTMKSGAILINTARGAIVDEEALADALRGGRLAGAGLDVFEEEPLAADHPLRRCPNVLLTPHTAGQTREAMERMVATLLENLERVHRGEEPLYRVPIGAVRSDSTAGASHGLARA